MKLSIPLLPVIIDIRKKKRVFGKAITTEKRYNKIFVIGFNKTGTTTLRITLEIFGFKVGNQAVAEILGIEWAGVGYPDKIIRYCKTADAFQDNPFSKPNLYKYLDLAYPGSKFILTKRDNAEQWFDSLIRFNIKMFSSDSKQLPTEKDLAKASYRYEGMALDYIKAFYNYPEKPLFHKPTYIEMYERHLIDVRNYFQGRSNDFIEINVARESDLNLLANFLNVKTNMKKFPWINKT